MKIVRVVYNLINLTRYVCAHWSSLRRSRQAHRSSPLLTPPIAVIILEKQVGDLVTLWLELCFTHCMCLPSKVATQKPLSSEESEQ